MGIVRHEVMKMKLLINRPMPINEESLASYLYRLAKANYFWSAHSFIESFGTTTAKVDNNEVTENVINMVANRAGYNALNIRSMAHIPFKEAWGEVIHLKVIMKNSVKYCPTCIDDCLHHKLIWCFHPISVCLKHRKMLVDRCEGCGSRISMSRLMSEQCGCGFVLKQSKGKTIKTKSYIYRSQEELRNEVLGGSNCKIFLGEYSLEEHINLAEHCFHLLSGMNSFIEHREKKLSAFHNKKDCFHDNEMYALLYGNVFWMFNDFPNNFYKVLDKLFETRAYPQLFYIKKNAFEQLFSESGFGNIQEAYEGYWLDKYNSGEIRLDFSVFKDKDSLKELRNYLTKDEIKMTCGFSYPMIESLVAKGLVEMRKVTKGKYKRHMIDRKNFNNILQKQSTMITRGEAAELLGVQRDSVTKLVKAGILEIKRAPFGQEKINIAEVKKLIADCSGKQGNIQGIQFHDVLIKYSVNGLSIQKLIEFIKGKRLVPYCLKRDYKLSDLLFNEHELEKCMVMLKKEQESNRGYYFNDVFKLLKIGEKMLWRFVDHEILVPDEVVTWKDGRKRYFFHKNKVDQFASAHVSISEATRKFDVCRNKLKMWHEAGWIKDYSKGLSKNYLFRVDELQALHEDKEKQVSIGGFEVQNYF
jgi:hypothetical protein